MACHRNKFTLLIFAVAMLIIRGCSGESNNGQKGRERLIPTIEAVKSQFGSLPLVERLSGVVKAENQVEIYPERLKQAQAAYQIASAQTRSVIGGLIVSTLITLILIPVAYISFYNLLNKLKTRAS